MAGKKLSAKQERFVQEYIIDLNGAAAARRAGYSARTAHEKAAQLLAIVSVQEAVAAAQARVAAKLELDAQTVLAELLLIAKSDIGQILDFSGTDPHLRPASEIPEKARRAISSVKVRRVLEGKGDEAREVELTEFKLWDKNTALDKLARHLKLLTDSLEVRGAGGGPLVLQIIEEVVEKDVAPELELPAESK